MKPFFAELFEYSHYMNQQLAEKFVSNQSIPAKAHKLFSHILCAHHIWNARINGQSASFKVWEVLPPKELKFTDRTNFEVTSLIIDTRSMEETVSYATSRGEKFSNTAGEILFHVVNHSTYHRAQIATAMKEAGLDPIVSDYIFYKR